jgi:uncharacterized protein
VVHAFSYSHNAQEYFFLWDIESGSLHNVDLAAFLCAKKRYNISLSNSEIETYLQLNPDVTLEVNNELGALEEAGALNATKTIATFRKKTQHVKALCLHICHDCNMRCGYCFADGGAYNCGIAHMSRDVGFAAVDFLIQNSGNRRNLEIDFFGGEPLLNFDTVKAIVAYAKSLAIKHNKQFSFTLTTNCIRLDKSTAEYLNREMSNVVLSIDGRRKVHDAVRRAVCENGTYDDVVKNALFFKQIRGSLNYYVRGTFTAKNLDFSNDVIKLHDLGFDAVSVEPVVLDSSHPLSIKTDSIDLINHQYEILSEYYLKARASGENFTFFHFILDLVHGPCIDKRLTGCGAGTEYLAVSPDGKLYPCHQFVGKTDFCMGNVFDLGLNEDLRTTFSSITVLNKEHCAECPAKYHCGGGCLANSLNLTGSLTGQYKIGCSLAKKRFEIALASAFLENSEGG